MPSLTSVIKQASRGADLYFVFRFLRLLTMKWTATDAYKYKIIDKKGNTLRKSSELETVNEKAAYTMLHRMVFKIRRLIEKVPIVGKSILLNYAAALFLLKEQKDTRIWTDEKYMARKLMEFLETDWSADAEFLQEEIKNKYGKTSASEFLVEEVEIEENPMVAGAAMAAAKKALDKKKKKDKKEEVEIEEGAVLDVGDVDKWMKEIEKGIDAPWIQVRKSTLGGDENVAIMIKLSLDAEKDWNNKILHNSRYAMISLGANGNLEMFAKGRGLKNMRKTKFKTAKDAIGKINTWIKQVDEEVEINEEVFYWYIIKGTTQKGKVWRTGTERQMKLLLRKPTTPSGYVLAKSRKDLSSGDVWKGSMGVSEEVEVDEVAPPGWEGTVKAMKKKKGIDNPWALAWHMHNKGDKPRIPEENEIEEMQMENTEKKVLSFGEFQLNEISMEAGKVYHQDTSDGPVYFKAVEQQKNKRWKGLVLDIGKKKPKSGSADEKLRFWQATPDKDVPPSLKEEVELDEEFSEKDFDSLKKGDTITIEFKSPMSSGKGTFKVTAKNIVGKAKVHKATLKDVKRPGGVKFFLYKRGNKVSLAQGDMAASVVKYTVEEVQIDEGPELQAMMALSDEGIKAKRKGKNVVVSKSDLDKAKKVLAKTKYLKVSLIGEEVPTVSTAGVAGLDTGLTFQKKKEDEKKAKLLRRKLIGEIKMTKFAGKDVFIVDSDIYHACRLGKKQYARYEKYVGNDTIGMAIREFGIKFPKRPIILQNGESGPMLYLKYGRS